MVQHDDQFRKAAERLKKFERYQVMFYRREWLWVIVVLMAMSTGFATAQETRYVPTATPLPARVVVDEGHVEEGLWEVTWKGKWSRNCQDLASQRNQQRSYIEVHYNEVPRLVFSSGRRTYEFKHMLGMYYEKDESGFIWLHEHRITKASPQALSGTTFTGWLEYRESACHFAGTFEALLIDTENVCLVANFFRVNIRAYPSRQSKTVGKLLDARRIVGKVRGDDNYDWWKLGEGEYVREDVVETTQSCEGIRAGYKVEHGEEEKEARQEETGQEIDFSQPNRGELVPLSAWLYESPALSASISGLCQDQEVVIVAGPQLGFYEVQCTGQAGFLEEKHIQFNEDGP